MSVFGSVFQSGAPGVGSSTPPDSGGGSTPSADPPTYVPFVGGYGGVISGIAATITTFTGTIS